MFYGYFYQHAKKIYRCNGSIFFPIGFFRYIREESENIEKGFDFLAKLKRIFEYDQKGVLNRQEIEELLSSLGENDYMNAAIRELFIKNRALVCEEVFVHKIIVLLSKEDVADSVIYTLLDSAIECEGPWVDKELLLDLLERQALTLDTFSLMIDYVHHF